MRSSTSSSFRKKPARKWNASGRRLTRIGRESVESQVIRTYLETIAELPWNKRSEERLDVQTASQVLDQDHYGLSDVKDRILEFLAVRQLAQGGGEGIGEVRSREEGDRVVSGR